MFRTLFKAVALLPAGVLLAQTTDVVVVKAEKVNGTISLPGEILPWQRVAVHARATGFVETILVDRGDVVKEGQLLATLSAPELAADTAQAESRVHVAEAARAEAEARLAGVEATWERLKAASATQGAIAGNELVQAEKAVAAAKANVASATAAVRSADAVVTGTKQSQTYLQVVAPFSGVITDRYVHPGALVGPGNGSAGPLVELQNVGRLRLTVAVPESEAAGVRTGAGVDFHVPAYAGRKFSGRVARIDRSLDAKTRTMTVELDVMNQRGELAPGMYADIAWPIRGATEALLVPASAIVTTTERTFVIRVRDGHAEWVDVRKGPAAGDLVSVLGMLKPGDQVLKRGSDEIRNGASLR